MSKAKLDGEARVQEHLASIGLRVERFTKAEMQQGRTPDFRVFTGDELACYCEVKTAQEDEWLDKQMAAAPPLTLAGGARPDPTYNRISSQIHSAVGQFDAVNPAMDLPNVLAIVNGDDGAGITDLIAVLTGNAYCESGEVWPMFRECSQGRIREEKLRVHLYLWSPPKSNAGQNLAVFAVSMFILYLLWTNFGYLLDTSSSQTGYASTATHSIKYMVAGDSFTNVTTGYVNVTMTNSSGGTEQHTVKTPWEKEFTASNGMFLYLSGQNEYDAGHAYVKIYVDGHLLQSADSHGVASVSGIVK
jgi:hypothetical protein